MIDNFSSKFIERKENFDNHLNDFFILDNICAYNNKFSSNIYDVMAYSLFSGGKRLRPICLLETASLYDVNLDDSLAFAIAIEMIHTYSLIHDDLPAMDDDDMRRGMPTSHIKYNEAYAILAGDSLLNLAHTVMLDKIINADYLPRMINASREISSKAGINGMIVGQVADIMSQSDDGDLKTIEFIHKNKTGALLEAAFVAGAYLGNATDSEIKIFREIALKIGYSFQIRDDILDIIGNSSDLGKNTGSDRLNDKLTYPDLVGMDESKKMVTRLSDSAIELLNNLPYNTEFLESLVNHLIYREK